MLLKHNYCKVAEKFALISLIALPFTNALALGVYKNIFTFIFFISVMFFFSSASFRKVNVSGENLIIILLLSVVVLAYIRNINDFINPLLKPLDAIKMWFFGVVFYYLYFKKIFVNVTCYRVTKYITYGVLISIFYGYVSFVAWVMGFNIDSYLPRSFGQGEMHYQVIGRWRFRSFLQEPGHYYFYLTCMFPAVYYYISKQSRMYRNIVLVVYIATLLGTFSAAGLFCTIVSIFFYYIYLMMKRIVQLLWRFKVKDFRCIFKYFAVFFIAIFVSAMAFEYTKEVFILKNFYDKISVVVDGSGEVNTSSAKGRLDRLSDAIEYINVKISGVSLMGEGYGAIGDFTGNNSLNFFLDLYVGVGLVGVLLWVIFILLHLKQSSQIIHYGPVLVVVIVYAQMHLIVMPELKYPYFWLLLVFPALMRGDMHIAARGWYVYSKTKTDK